MGNGSRVGYAISPQTPRHYRASSATEDDVEEPICKSLTPLHHVGHTKGLSVCNNSGKGWSGKLCSTLASLLVSYRFLPAQTVTLEAEERVGTVS